MPSISSSDSVQKAIRNHALSLGFDAVGFAVPALSASVRQGLQEFITGGHHGEMGWMEEKMDRRSDPKTLWPEAKSVIMLGHNYGPDFNPMEKLAHKDRGVISAYALNQDYHHVIKKKLKELARWVAEHFHCEVKVFVDTAPVMEKPLAEAAGLGWQGKHTCLISREFGSWLFLGSIFTTLEFTSPLVGEGDAKHRVGGNASQLSALIDPPLPNPLPQGERELVGGCGSCTRCLDICPTRAFSAAGKLDARRCIAYLTIEHKGQIPLELRKAIGNRIYGCDDCLAVCPWNKFAQASKEQAYHPRSELEAPLLRELAQLDDAAFRRLFAKSPIKRLGRNRFVRNVALAMGNSGDASLADALRPLLQDASALVAEMAAWALAELTSQGGIG